MASRGSIESAPGKRGEHSNPAQPIAVPATPTLPRLTQSEALHSLNHLYQLSVYYAIRSYNDHCTPSDSGQANVQLQSLARKATLRLDASIKRSICRNCSVPLIPGLTCKIRCRTAMSTSRSLVTSCRICSHKRRLLQSPLRPDNANSNARRHRKAEKKRTATALQAKVRKFRLAAKAGKSSLRDKVMDESAARIDRQPATRNTWSQRARRRAGRKKAISLARLAYPAIEYKAVEPERNSRRRGKRRKQKGTIGLPRYADRMRAEGASWETPLLESGSDGNLLEAMRSLRGNHMITTGIARGGNVGSTMSRV